VWAIASPNWAIHVSVALSAQPASALRGDGAQALEPSNRRTVEPSNRRTLEPSNPRTFEPSNPRTLYGIRFGKEAAMAPARPVSTYRLQMSAAFTFADATAITDYLASLGISHAYTSSYFMAVPGSTHGYDVADPTRLNPEIGDETSYTAWVAALRRHGMGHIIDLVPNHMGIARSANPWWQDVLENGESSRYAEVFDIDWQPLKPELEHRVLIPVLGDLYGEVLERQELALVYERGAFHITYFEQRFPVAPGTYDRILTLAAPDLLNEIGEDTEHGTEFLSIITAIRHLPGRVLASSAERVERDREKEVVKRRLAALTAASPAVHSHIQRVITRLNGVAGDPHSFDELDALLSAQPYRLAYWRVAGEEINYRRFFDINELAAIRMEDPAIFDLTHAYAFELLERGCIDGFRIDHVDGLFDPGDYLTRLRARARAARPDFASDPSAPYVVVEKILGTGEQLPSWPIAGTTGYDFLVMVNGLFVDMRQERAITGVYEQFTRLRDPYREIVYRGKQLVLGVSMASELNVLAHRLNRFSERHRHYRDFTLNSLTQAMREIIACFPVYRTYVNDRDPVLDRDRDYINRAVAEAKRRNPNRPGAVYDFVGDLLLRRAGFIPADDATEHLRFVGKFQQVTSPVTAKGIEDTALYIYNRLVSLNEVGGEPDHFGTSVPALHAWLTERSRQWPHGLSTTSTHDTKRSEDVRARLNLLTEIPGAWKQATGRWARINRRARTTIDGHSYPSRNEEYLFYQTLVGSWPLGEITDADHRAYTARIVAYMQKAMREAKVYTSWLNPSARHEEAMTRFVEAVLAPENEAFHSDFLEFQRRVSQLGLFNSLSQLLLKITAPGVPDFYQGTELWDFSLVDPDNRRPVDYERRRRLLQEIDEALTAGERRALVERLVSFPEDDRLKLYTSAMALRFRGRHPAVFAEGTYVPVAVEGPRRDHVFAFLRSHESTHILVAVPRLVATLTSDTQPPVGERIWGDMRLVLPALPVRGWHHVFTNACVPHGEDGGRASVLARDLFEHFPVACVEGR
jgi:(1->4)-alpha-D-glucan 1-alpha-D-glucosylmutase